MTKKQVKALWEEVKELPEEEGLQIWYENLPKKILSKLETPCWGIREVEEHYNVDLDD